MINFKKIKSVFDNLLINFEVMMRSKLLENTKLVDYLFYRDLRRNHHSCFHTHVFVGARHQVDGYQDGAIGRGGR